ncbi:MAG TPA: NADPH-dependent FMN reductase [Burkholderiales bacterium]
MKILGLCGSLRAASINAGLLRSAVRLAPVGVEMEIAHEVGRLPLFNPDLENDPPRIVRDLCGRVARADALVVASPEYAHGVTGVIKNALDWLVSMEDFAGKPVAIWNASPRAHHSDDALREILLTMSADVVAAASIGLPLVGAGVSEAAMRETPAIAQAIRGALACLQAHRA